MLMIALQLLMQVLKLSITIEMMNILLNSLNQLNLQLKISACDPPVIPRQRRIPRRLSDGTSQHQFTTVEDMHRKEYFEGIDAVKGELERRFRQQNFLFAQTVEKLLLDSANGKSVAITEKIQEIYNGVDMQKLKLHLQMRPDVIKCSLLDGISIKKVTRVHTIC